MPTIAQLVEEANKVIAETIQGGNTQTRIGNLYLGIISFLDILDQRTIDGYQYDDTALKEAIARVDAAIGLLDRALEDAVALATQERDRLDALINELDSDIADKVNRMMDDAAWLEEHARGIRSVVNEGEIYWQSGWNENIEAYLQEVGVWAREGDVIKTQWSELKQDVASIQSTVAEVQTDLAGRPTSTQWSQITQKVNSIEQSVNKLLYNGEVTEALQASINQSIDGNIASLNLDTTYAKKEVEGSEHILEWMYSAFKNASSSDMTYAQLVSAGKSGINNGVSEVRTYVNAIRDGDFLKYEAVSSIEAKVDDVITGLYNKASAGDAKTTIFSQVKKDSSDIATIITHATNDYSEADVATKFDNWRSGLVLYSNLDSTMASLLSAGEESRSGIVLTSKVDEATTDILSQVGNMTSGFLLTAKLGEATAQMVASDRDSGATAAIIAKVNRSGSEIMLSADQVTMTNLFVKRLTANTAFIGYLTGGDATFTGHINARSLSLGSDVSIPQGNINGLTDALDDKADKDEIPTAITDLIGGDNLISTDDVIVGATTTDSNGVKSRKITVGDVEYTEIVNDDFVIFGKSKGTDSENNKYFKIDSDGLLKARNAIIYGTIYATSGEFSGTIHATDGDFSGSIKASNIIGDIVVGSGRNKIYIKPEVGGAYFQATHDSTEVLKLGFDQNAGYLKMTSDDGLNFLEITNSKFGGYQRNGIKFTIASNTQLYLGMSGEKFVCRATTNDSTPVGRTDVWLTDQNSNKGDVYIDTNGFLKVKLE